MKKTLIAVAALSAVCGSAIASDVTMYGRVDLGFNYLSTDDGFSKERTDSFSMDSSNGTSSRFGLKGTEDLGNGYKVGFVLENGFNPDDGSFKTSDRLFDREAIIRIDGDFGTAAFGRTTIMGTDGGSFNALGIINPFGTGLSYIGNQNMVFGKVSGSRFDNVIVYRSPVMSGLQVTAEHSMGSNDYENKSGSERYSGLAFSYKNAGLEMVLLTEHFNEAAVAGVDAVATAGKEADGVEANASPKDMIRVTFGGNYDLGAAKVYASTQWFTGANALGSQGFKDGFNKKFFGNADAAVGSMSFKKFDELEGVGVIVGADTTVAGGTLMAAVGYMDAKSDEFDIRFDVNSGFAGVGYFYPLSKRTKLYTGMGWDGAKYETKYEKAKADAYYATFGMAHYF